MGLKIDIEQVINRTKHRLGLMDTTLADAYLEKLINEGSLHINSLNQFIISCETLDIECGMAKLPFGATDVIAFSFIGEGCSGCCSISHNPESGFDRNMMCSCSQYYVSDRSVLVQMGELGCDGSLWNNRFTVQAGYLHFPSTVTSTEVRVWHRGYNMDGDGLMILDELQERGLSAYAAYEYALSNPQRFTPFQITEWKKTWVAQKGYLKGQAQQQDYRLNKDRMASIARAIVINPLNITNLNL